MDLSLPFLEIIERLLDLLTQDMAAMEATLATYGDELSRIKASVDDLKTRVTTDLQALKDKIANGTVSDADEATVQAIIDEVTGIDTADTGATTGGGGPAPKASGSLHPKHP